MRSLLSIGFLFCFVACAIAGNSPDLNALAAKAAAKVQGLIANTRCEVQGSTAVIKKSTVVTPDLEVHGGIVMSVGAKSTEKPSDKGVMMIIQFSHLPYAGPSMPQTPQIDPKHAQRTAQFFRTGAVQQFPAKNVAMAVQILFGPFTDLAPVQRAYSELTRFVSAELGH